MWIVARRGPPRLCRGVAPTCRHVYLDPPRFSAVRTLNFIHITDLVTKLTSARTSRMTASTRTGTGTLDLSPNAVTVLERRYLIKDDQGRPVERPEDLFWRVARTVAEPDRAHGPADK